MSGLRTDFSECSSLCTCSQQQQPRKPFLIGVSGGTASGKSTVCQKIVQQLGDKEGDNENNQRVSIISLDSFYKDLTDEENELALLGKFDFDHPRVFDYELLKRTLLELINGKTIEIFDYDHKLHKRNKEKSRKISSADVILVEGILVFYQEDVRALFNMKLFVDTDADTRLARRVERDIEKYDRPLDSILYQYITFVKPAFEEFCLPTKKYADVIIPRGADNKVAVDLIVQHIKDLLHKNASSKHRFNSSSGYSSCPIHHKAADTASAVTKSAVHGPAAVSGPAAAINRNSSLVGINYVNSTQGGQQARPH